MQSLANAVMLGSLYALIAIGYTIIYGILKLINFAHGNVFMMSMYFAFYAVALVHLPWYLAFLLAIVMGGTLGVLIEKVAYRPMRDAPRSSLRISAIGMSFLLENLAVVCFSGIPKNFPSVAFFQETIALGSIRIQRLNIYAPILSILLVVILVVFLNKTKTGIAMRACSRDYETVRLMGINVNRVISITFLIGSVLAAVGAMIWALKYPKIDPYVGTMPGMKCFIAAVIGGIGSIPGAFLGAMLLGFVEIMLVMLFPSLSSYRDVFAFVMLIIILLVKPSGIFGEASGDKA